MIFPRYIGEDRPRLIPISRSRAAFMLGEQALNRHAFPDGTIQVLSRLVQSTACFVLESGSAEKTCEVIESLLPT